MEKLKKNEFVEKIYNLIKNSRTEFERVSDLPDRACDAVFNIQSAIQYGSQYIEAYNLLKRSVISNPELNIYYIDDEGIMDYCSKEKFEMMEKMMNVINPEADNKDYI